MSLNLKDPTCQMRQTCRPSAISGEDCGRQSGQQEGPLLAIKSCPPGSSLGPSALLLCMSLSSVWSAQMRSSLDPKPSSVPGPRSAVTVCDKHTRSNCVAREHGTIFVLPASFPRPASKKPQVTSSGSHHSSRELPHLQNSLCPRLCAIWLPGRQVFLNPVDTLQEQ